jgi:hypothetical protein
MADDTHQAFLETNKRHESVATYDNGACVIKHQFPYTEKDSCSYRWQGIKKAEEQPGRSAYDAHRAPECHLGKRPLGVKNFTTGWAPYGNQVHHVLNQSSLHKGINGVAEVWPYMRRTIVNGLLKEKYNLNHKDNNLICPTADYHSRETGLPTHIGSHKTYSAKILTSVKNALEPYKKIANQLAKKQKKHDKPDPLELKDALENISNTMYQNIVGLAAGNRLKRRATTVDSLPSKAYLGI